MRGILFYPITGVMYVAYAQQQLEVSYINRYEWTDDVGKWDQTVVRSIVALNLLASVEVYLLANFDSFQTLSVLCALN